MIDSLENLYFIHQITLSCVLHVLLLVNHFNCKSLSGCSVNGQFHSGKVASESLANSTLIRSQCFPYIICLLKDVLFRFFLV